MFDFVIEITERILNRIDVELLNYNNILTVGYKKVIVDTFCCDTHVWAFGLKTKSHAGIYFCARCTVRGQYLLRHVYFPNL